jgi:hypothetical protein
MIIKEIKLSSGNLLKMVYLTESDKNNITNMHPDCSVYSVYEDKKDTNEVLEKITKFKKDCEKKKENNLK